MKEEARMDSCLETGKFNNLALKKGDKVYLNQKTGEIIVGGKTVATYDPANKHPIDVTAQLAWDTDFDFYCENTEEQNGLICLTAN